MEVQRADPGCAPLVAGYHETRGSLSGVAGGGRAPPAVMRGAWLPLAVN